MSGGKGSNTTTTTQTPPPEVMNRWNNIMDRGTAIADQPLPLYGGPQVAPFTPSQGQAFRTVDAAQGMSLPYISEGADFFRRGAAPINLTPWSARGMGEYFSPWESNVMRKIPQFSRGAINQYLDPYLEDVVGAEQNRMVEDERRQRQDLVGNAISAGAWGGDRAGIAQAELMRQQKIARDSALARLRSEGYGQAVGQFGRDQALTAQMLGQGYGIAAGQYGDERGRDLQAQQASRQLAQSAGAGIAGLGTQALTDTLRGAEAQGGIGAQQQQQAQRYLDVPYQQFQQLQAYPWESTQFLSNLLSAYTGAAGGSSSTKTPGPNPISQIIGLGMTAAGLPVRRRGGRVHQRATGGRVPGGFIPLEGWVPVRSSLPAPPPAPEEESGLEDYLAMAGQAGLFDKDKMDATPATPKITTPGPLPWRTGHTELPWLAGRDELPWRRGYAPGGAIPGRGPVFDMEQDADGNYALPDLGDAPAPTRLTIIPPPAPAASPQPSPQQQNGLMAMLSKGGADPRMAMIMAGLSMAAGESPNALTNIAKGGIAGMGYLIQERQYAEKTAQRERELDMEAERLAETAKYHSGALDLGRDELEYKKRKIDEGEFKPTTHSTVKDFLERVGMDYPDIIDPATGYWSKEMDKPTARALEKAFVKYVRENNGDFESAYAQAMEDVTGGRGFAPEDNPGWFTGDTWKVTPGAGGEEGGEDNPGDIEGLDDTDPRVQEALDEGFTLEQIQKFLKKNSARKE